MGFPREMHAALAAQAETEILPENEMPFDCFRRLRTQWRVGVSGATGLDYAAAESVLRAMRVPPAQRLDALDALRVMEDEALLVMSEKSGR